MSGKDYAPFSPPRRSSPLPRREWAMAIGQKVRMRLPLVVVFLLSPMLAAQGPVRAVVPPTTSVHASRFCSPAVDAGDYVYVSGQGPLRPDGSTPATFAADVVPAHPHYYFHQAQSVLH